MIRISYGNLSEHTDVDVLYATDTPAYAARIKFILMNIIRALSTLALCLLTAPFSQAVLSPIGPLDFASGATTLDFAALPTGTEANGLVLDAVLF